MSLWNVGVAFRCRNADGDWSWMMEAEICAIRWKRCWWGLMPTLGRYGPMRRVRMVGAGEHWFADRWYGAKRTQDRYMIVHEHLGTRSSASSRRSTSVFFTAFSFVPSRSCLMLNERIERCTIVGFEALPTGRFEEARVASSPRTRPEWITRMYDGAGGCAGSLHSGTVSWVGRRDPASFGIAVVDGASRHRIKAERCLRDERETRDLTLRSLPTSCSRAEDVHAARGVVRALNRALHIAPFRHARTPGHSRGIHAVRWR